MGIPTFLRNFVRHQGVIDVVKQDSVSSVKILCIDLNSMIHEIYNNASDLRNASMASVMPDEFMLSLIPNVISELRSVVEAFKPAVTYIGVDGAAPLAKVSQQRKRRFLGGDQYRVQISPGTRFMDALDSRLRKMESSSTEFVVSGSGERGEGEVKIFRFLEESPLASEGDVAIYGADADIIVRAFIGTPERVWIFSTLKTRKNMLNRVNVKKLRKIFAESVKSSSRIYGLRAAIEGEGPLFMKNLFFMTSLVLGNDFVPKIPSLSHNMDLYVFVDKFMLELSINREMLAAVTHMRDEGVFVKVYKAFLRSLLGGEREKRYVASVNESIKNGTLPELAEDIVEFYASAAENYEDFKQRWYSPHIEKMREYAPRLSLLQHHEAWTDDARVNSNALRTMEEGGEFWQEFLSQRTALTVRWYLYMCLWTLSYYVEMDDNARLDMLYPYEIAPFVEDILREEVYGHRSIFWETKPQIPQGENRRVARFALHNMIHKSSAFFPREYRWATSLFSPVSDMHPSVYTTISKVARVEHERGADIAPVDPYRAATVWPIPT